MNKLDKFLSTAKAYMPLLPPLGDLPDDRIVETFSWAETKKNEEIKFIFPKPIKRSDKISDTELPGAFYYDVEVTVIANSIEEAAERSVFILQQVLDTASLYSQAACKIVSFQSIVNLSQIERVLEKTLNHFERGIFRTQSLRETKAFPPGRLVFLSERGVRGIGRNLFWFRKGLNEFSSIYRFVSFFTALNELNLYFSEAHKKDSSLPSSVKAFVENDHKMVGKLKVWGDIRNDIIHFSGRKKDYRKINYQAKRNLEEVYQATYFGLMKFFTDTPPQPAPLISYDEIEKESVLVTPEIQRQLKDIYERRKIVSEFVMK